MNLQHYSLEETDIPKVSIIQNWYTAQISKIWHNELDSL
jgi:hypothetical protein